MLHCRRLLRQTLRSLLEERGLREWCCHGKMVDLARGVLGIAKPSMARLSSSVVGLTIVFVVEILPGN